jgi:restriction endonuclease Mrr
MDWVFQSNPTMYDVVAALKENALDSNWSMNQHRTDVTPGDRIFFWRSGADAAIVAVGQVTSPVYNRGDESEFGQYAVNVNYQYSIDPVLTRAEIKAHPLLSVVRVFTRAQGTNFPLTEEQAAALESLLESRKHSVSVQKQTRPLLDSMKGVTEALRLARRENVLRVRQFISQMDPFAFEWLVAAVLVRSGYTDVEVTPRSGDKGIDVRATIKAGGFAPLKVFVQAKRTPSVGSPVVQRLRGSCPSGFSAMLVTSGEFSKEARDEAGDPTKHNSVTLIAGEQFAELMLDHGVGAERRQLETHVLALEQMTEQRLKEIVQIPEP